LLQQLSNILKDPESSSNDKFVALELLKNASIAANMVLPGCQDTGTAICMGKIDIKFCFRSPWYDLAEIFSKYYDNIWNMFI
jgi:tartrate dehydratase alpha subunit/fumarate hydratase class I-like protein